MSGGRFELDAPHICGEIIHVVISWSSYPGNYENPPEYDEDWDHVERCPKCNVDLGWDDLFQKTVQEIAKHTDPGEDMQDGPDFDYEDAYEPVEMNWDDDE